MGKTTMTIEKIRDRRREAVQPSKVTLIIRFFPRLEFKCSPFSNFLYPFLHAFIAHPNLISISNKLEFQNQSLECFPYRFSVTRITSWSQWQSGEIYYIFLYFVFCQIELFMSILAAHILQQVEKFMDSYSKIVSNGRTAEKACAQRTSTPCPIWKIKKWYPFFAYIDLLNISNSIYNRVVRIFDDGNNNEKIDNTLLAYYSSI
jgi:hypothetical protein